jgi:multicomponent Na+:H+ antiporter subunit F
VNPILAIGLNPADAAPYVLGILMFSAFLALVRLVRGPTLGDRVVSMEVLGAIVASSIVVTALSSGQPVLIDVALIFGLVSFIGTLGFARFVALGARGG